MLKLENLKLNLETELVLNVGDPVGKTNAPRCYNKLFERLDMNAIMLPCEIKKGQLPEFIDACHLMGIHYLCPTMPHKGDFVDLLDDVDETSRLFHSVNAIRFDENGSHGAGMDGKGAVKALQSGGAKLDGINALMYGAGGISGVVAYELSRQNVKKLYIANRTPEKAESIARILREHSATEVEVIGTDQDSLNQAAENCELYANLTPLGMSGFPYNHDYLGFIDRMPETATVFDCIINPPMSETIAKAKQNGLNVVPGMQMLVSQMDVIFEFMFQKTITEADKAACIDELCSYLNVASPK
ncbi:MAG: shikimate dehydrogenase family protein [Lachnospiraceae bacterium]